MRIDSSSLSMAAESGYIEKNTKEEAYRSWGINAKQDSGGANPQTGAQGIQFKIPQDILDISEKGREELAKQARLASSQKAGEENGISFELDDRDKQKLLLIQKMVEALTGKKIKFIVPEKIRLDRSSGKLEIKLPPAPSPVILQPRAGWGVEYDLHEVHYEKQELSFNARGVVKTADGREINLNVSLELGREYTSSRDVSVRLGDAARVDPLIINFDSPSARLTEDKISFDLDSDGKAEQMSFVANGSGFLTLDKNNDGRINDGSELFGPQSGNGFAELARYDGDGNGWIDENDDIYDRLRIWTKDEQGNDQLLALGSKGIGAIYLGSAAASYDLKGSQNQTLGAIGSTGIFLRENGSVGTIQHVDLAV